MRLFILSTILVAFAGRTGRTGCADIIATAEARNSSSQLAIDSESGSGNPLTINAGVFSAPGAPSPAYRAFAEGTTVGNSLQFRFENEVTNTSAGSGSVFTTVEWRDQLVGAGNHKLTFGVHGQVDIADGDVGLRESWNFSVDSGTTGPGGMFLPAVRVTGTDADIDGITSFGGQQGWSSFSSVASNPNEFNGVFSVIIPGATDFFMSIRSNALTDSEAQIRADLMSTVQLLSVKDSFGTALNTANFGSGFQFQASSAAVPEPSSTAFLTIGICSLMVCRFRKRRRQLQCLQS